MVFWEWEYRYCPKLTQKMGHQRITLRYLNIDHMIEGNIDFLCFEKSVGRQLELTGQEYRKTN